MPYRMKNRFLILGLTGALGSGCSDTAKFLSGQEVRTLSIENLLDSQVKFKDDLNKKIPSIYNEIETVKKAINNRLDKNLGPYKRQFIDPNEDPIVKSHERKAKDKHHKLKIYLTRREIIKVLEDLANDESLRYENLSEDDKRLFGFQPFAKISFTVVIIKIAIETYYADGGKRLLSKYFTGKYSDHNSSYEESTYSKLKEVIEDCFAMVEKDIDSYLKSMAFIRERGYSLHNNEFLSNSNAMLLEAYSKLIKKVAINFYEYISRIEEIQKKLKDYSHKQIEDDYVFAFSEILQDWGDNCRATGNPFKKIPEGGRFNTESLYTLSEEINCIIKFLRFRVRYLDQNYCPISGGKDRNHVPSLFVVECFRNPYEVEFFRARYAEFYLVSIFAPQKVRCKRIKYFSFNRDRRDQGDSKKASELYKLDVRSCVLLSDINVRNDKVGKNTQKTYFEKVLRYLALLRSPGCIPPNDDELYMHLAYSNSLKSNCISRKVGAIIIGPKGYILGAGWNDVGEGQIGCGLRTKDDYLNIDSIPQVTSKIKKEEFHELVRKSTGEYICYKDLMSKMQIEKKLNKQSIQEICTGGCIEKIKTDLGIKRLEFCRALHAEENALLQIAKVGGVPVNGGTIYTTTYPCELCAKKLYQTGIRAICYTEPYPESISEEVFLKDGIRSIEMIPFEGVKSYSYFKLFKPVYDKKELPFIEDSKS